MFTSAQEMPLSMKPAPQPLSDETAPPRRGTHGWMTNTGLIVVKWSRWGKRRLYVNTADERRVGWQDLDTNERTLEIHELGSAFVAALEEAALLEESVGGAPRRTLPEPTVDLAFRRPGEHLEEHIATTLEAGRELKPAVPEFEGRRAYSSWELGVQGEQMVAEELERLVALDPRWGFLNSIPVGTHGADIDHLVAGPGGVFTLNAKHHHGGEVWVADGACMVNGAWRHYVDDSRSEAALASALLSAAVGMEVVAMGVIVLVGVAKLDVKVQPADVHVLKQTQVVDFLRHLPQTLSPESSAAMLSCARQGDLWR